MTKQVHVVYVLYNACEKGTHLIKKTLIEFYINLFLAEEILDDGVGLLLESSGDSLDDDSEIFSEFEGIKVRYPVY